MAFAPWLMAGTELVKGLGGALLDDDDEWQKRLAQQAQALREREFDASQQWMTKRWQSTQDWKRRALASEGPLQTGVSDATVSSLGGLAFKTLQPQISSMAASYKSRFGGRSGYALGALNDQITKALLPLLYRLKQSQVEQNQQNLRTIHSGNLQGAIG